MKKLLHRIKGHITETVMCAIALILAIVLITAEFDKNSNYKDQAYSSYGTAADGFNVIYRSVKTAGDRYGLWDTERFAESSRFLPENCIYICPTSSPLDVFEDNGISELGGLVKNGSVLVFVGSSSITYDLETLLYKLLTYDGDEEDEDTEGADDSESSEILSSASGDYWWYGVESPESFLGSLVSAFGGTETVSSAGVSQQSSRGLDYYRAGWGEGSVCYLSYDGLLNADLAQDETRGAAFMLLLEDICGENGFDKIIFDDYYAGIDTGSAWDALGAWFILGLAELGLAALLFILHKARRFGAPEAVAELENRSETEGVEALAVMYRTTGAAAVAFSVNMEDLLYDLQKQNGLPADLTAPEIAGELCNSKDTDPEIRSLCKAYLAVQKGEISEKQAKKLIERTDLVKQSLK